MKLIRILFLTLTLITTTACAGSPVTVQLHVVDNDGKPVENVSVGMGFLLGQGGNSFDGVTDSNGYIKATRNATYGVKIYLEKEGYYRSKYRTGYGDQDLTLVLREKKNPIAMYAKNTKILPPDGKPVNTSQINIKFGYDLMVGDYVRPYGNGKISDLLLEINYQEVDFWNNDYNLTIEFSNLNDGLLPFFIEHSESVYKSGYLAPLGGYKNKWEFHRFAVKGQPDDTNFNAKNNYYFRIRSVINSDGEIESAYYGKTYGEFPEMRYMLNPEKNNRNVEYSIYNLLTDLTDTEKVRQP